MTWLAVLLLAACTMGFELQPAPADAADAVREAFLHAWSGYERHAWSHDEVRPTSNRTNDSWGGFGVTLIDGLDTAMLMGLRAPVARAMQHIRALDFARDWPASTFEYTIRYVGGLLGAYALDRSPVLLIKATEMGERLLPAFHSRSGIPYGSVNLLTGVGHSAAWLQGRAVLAEAGSVQLEYLALQRYSNSSLPFAALSARAMSVLLDARPADMGGLFPVFIDVATGLFAAPYSASVGALSDSFYETLLKQWIAEGKQSDSPLLRAWRAAWQGIRDRLLLTSRDGHVFIGELGGDGVVQPVMDHLSCHMAGVLALAAMHFPHDAADYLRTATALADTCWHLYARSATGLGPERVRFAMAADTHGDDITVLDPKYILRPELVESLYYMHTVTGDAVWRARAWAVFGALQRHCRTATAYSGLEDVDRPGVFNDSMQSFFLAETLKYLFLTFEEHPLVSLREWLFTTEGHAIPLRDLKS